MGIMDEMTNRIVMANVNLKYQIGKNKICMTKMTIGQN